MAKHHHWLHTAALMMTLALVGCGNESLELEVTSSVLEMEVVPVRFKVGFGKVDISTQRVVTLGGYGTYVGLTDVSRKSTAGVHDPLFASAVAIEGIRRETLVLVSVDSVGLSGDSVQRIRDRVEAQLHMGSMLNVHMAATHTHQAPDTMGLWGTIPVKNGRDPAYMAQMEQGVADAVVAAVRAKTEATLAWAQGSKPNSHSDSADADQRDDRVVTVIARTPAGTVLGTLTQWAAHPTTLNHKNNSISADYVGAFRYYMEQKYGGVHVYLNGALGDTYAKDDGTRRADPFVHGAKDPDVLDGYRKMAAQGHSLFTVVDQALTNGARPLSNPSVTSTRGTVWVPIDNDIFLWAMQLGFVEKDQKQGRVLTEVNWFKIGELRGATLPGESFPRVSNEVRKHLVAKGAVATMIVDMGDDWLGYLMSQRDHDDPELSYNRSLCPHPDAASTLVARLQQILW